MLTAPLLMPISVFSLSEIGVDLNKMASITREFYSFYQEDEYLLRYNKIEFLKKIFRCQLSVKLMRICGLIFIKEVLVIENW